MLETFWNSATYTYVMSGDTYETNVVIDNLTLKIKKGSVTTDMAILGRIFAFSLPSATSVEEGIKRPCRFEKKAQEGLIAASFLFNGYLDAKVLIALFEDILAQFDLEVLSGAPPVDYYQTA